MSLKVRTIDQFYHKKHNIHIDISPFQDCTYFIEPTDIIYTNRLNTSINPIADPNLNFNSVETENLYPGEKTYGHFLEVPDPGICLKRKDISINFWFHVPSDFDRTSSKFMTFLQGHTAFGGHFIVTKGKLV